VSRDGSAMCAAIRRCLTTDIRFLISGEARLPDCPNRGPKKHSARHLFFTSNRSGCQCHNYPTEHPTDKPS
jgi:hypothetical protein